MTARSLSVSNYVPALVGLVTFVIWLSSFQGAFVGDDLPTLYGADGQSGISGWQLDDVTTVRPRFITNATLAWNYWWNDEHVWGYHLVNVLLHSLTAVLVCLLIHPELQRTNWAPTSPIVSWLVGGVTLLWSLHPLQTESVTYIVQRAEIMAGLGMIGHLLFLRVAIQSVGWTRIVCYVVSLFWAAFAYGSKDNAVVLPLLALAYEVMVLGTGWKQVLRERWWFYACTIVPLLVVMPGAIERLTRPDFRSHVGFGSDYFTWSGYVASQGRSLSRYLKLSVWPTDLCFDYGWSLLQRPIVIVAYWILPLILLGAGLWTVRRNRKFSFLIFSFFLLLAPTSLIPFADICVEHRMYLALLPVLLVLVTIVGWAVSHMSKGGQLAGTIMLMVPLCLLAVLTIERNGTYRSLRTLVLSDLAINPENVRLLRMELMTLPDGTPPAAYLRRLELINHLAEKRGWWLSGEAYYYRADLADMYLAAGRFSEAEPLYRKALEAAESDGERARAHWAIGISRDAQDDPINAQKHLTRALELQDDARWRNEYRQIQERWRTTETESAK